MVAILDITPETEPADCWYCGHQHTLREGETCPQCGRLQDTRPIGTGMLSRPPTHVNPVRRGDPTFQPGTALLLQVLPSGACAWFTLDRPLTLGRAVGPVTETLFDLNDFNAHLHGVSRRHCRLTRKHDRVVLTDLGSTNGTYLNGTLLAPYQEVILADGDQLILGTLHITVFFVRSRAR